MFDSSGTGKNCIMSSCDVIILGLDNAGAEFDLLLKELDRSFMFPHFSSPVACLLSALPALRQMEIVSAPFNSTALQNAIARVVQGETRQPGGSGLEKERL